MRRIIGAILCWLGIHKWEGEASGGTGRRTEFRKVCVRCKRLVIIDRPYEHYPCNAEPIPVDGPARAEYEEKLVARTRARAKRIRQTMEQNGRNRRTHGRRKGDWNKPRQAS